MLSCQVFWDGFLACNCKIDYCTPEQFVCYFPSYTQKKMRWEMTCMSGFMKPGYCLLQWKEKQEQFIAL